MPYTFIIIAAMTGKILRMRIRKNTEYLYPDWDIYPVRDIYPDRCLCRTAIQAAILVSNQRFYFTYQLREK